MCSGPHKMEVLFASNNWFSGDFDNPNAMRNAVVLISYAFENLDQRCLEMRVSQVRNLYFYIQDIWMILWNLCI